MTFGEVIINFTTGELRAEQLLHAHSSKSEDETKVCFANSQ